MSNHGAPPFRCETGFVDLTADSSSDNDEAVETGLSSAKKPRPLSAVRRLARQGGLRQPPWQLIDPSHTDSPTLETSRQPSADLDQECADSTDCESGSDQSDASVAAMPSTWPSWKVMRQLIGMQTPPRRESQPPRSQSPVDPRPRRGDRRQNGHNGHNDTRVRYCEIEPEMPASVARGTEDQIDRWHALHGVERHGEATGEEHRGYASDEPTSSSCVDSEETDVDSDRPEDPEALMRSINRRVLRLPEGYLETNAHKCPGLVEAFTRLIK